MPNIKSAKKRVLVAEANNQRNKAARSALRTAIKNANTAEDKEAAVSRICACQGGRGAEHRLHIRYPD